MNIRSTSVTLTISWFEVTKNVDCGVPCQNTTASVPKLMPLIVMVKGTLLTGTLPGVNVVIEGGEDTNILSGSPGVDDFGFPHPIVIRRLTSRTPKYRITTSGRFKENAARRPINDTRLSLSEAPVKMKEFATDAGFCIGKSAWSGRGNHCCACRQVPNVNSLFRMTNGGSRHRAKL